MIVKGAIAFRHLLMFILSATGLDNLLHLFRLLFDEHCDASDIENLNTGKKSIVS